MNLFRKYDEYRTYRKNYIGSFLGDLTDFEEKNFIIGCRLIKEPAAFFGNVRLVGHFLCTLFLFPG